MSKGGMGNRKTYSVKGITLELCGETSEFISRMTSIIKALLPSPQTWRPPIRAAANGQLHDQQQAQLMSLCGQQQPSSLNKGLTQTTLRDYQTTMNYCGRPP